MKPAFISRTLLAVLCLGVCAALSQPPPKMESKVSLEILPNPLVLKVLGRSQLDFVADLFWVRMANMAGRCFQPSECAALLPIANLIADLAPKFKYPYFVGGTLAPVHLRNGSWANVEGAHALMVRGLQELPDYTRLRVQLAFTELDIMHDPARAGRTLREAAKLPDAPPFLLKLAARLLTEGGQYEDAREFARAMTESDDPELKEDFEHRLKMIDLEEVLVKVDDAQKRFTEAQGHPAARPEELVMSGFLSQLPVDPFGGTIELTPEGARSSVESRRLRAYVPPQ